MKVPPWFYRLLWITVAVIGTICAVGLATILALDQDMTAQGGKPVLIGVGVFGAIMLVYALRRLLWPLKAPPRS